MTFKNSLILVTGGAGSIGYNLVRRLQQEKAKIIVVDDLSSGFEDNIAGIPDVRLVKASITNDNILVDVFNQPINYIFHLAASFANQKSIEYPLDDLDTNIVGTLKLLQHSTKLKELRRFYPISYEWSRIGRIFLAAGLASQPCCLPLGSLSPKKSQRQRRY